MSDLSSTERRKLERLFRMRRGYVLDFTDGTLRAFVAEHCGLDLNASRYGEPGASKAERLRRLWTIENNRLAAQLIEALVFYAQDLHYLCAQTTLADECRKIAVGLLSSHEAHHPEQSSVRQAKPCAFSKVPQDHPPLMTRIHLI